MDPYRRHQLAFRCIYLLCTPFLRRKFNLTHEDLRVDGPVLLVSNHACAYDPLLVAFSLWDKPVYYVASEHLFRMGIFSRILEYLVAPIPRRKASSGMDTVKACLRHLKAGHSICLFAEGEQCWAGQNIPIFPATGKLAKSSGATLVTYRLEGAYLSLPRWGKRIRTGKVYAHPVGIYPPEELKRMTPQEINELINRDIAEDAWERQRKDPVAYRGKRRAEGMERAVYLCPRCQRVGTLQTKGNRIFCGCGLDLEYTETGFFNPAEPFSDLAQWDTWQREALRKRTFSCPPPPGPLFSDPEISLYRLSAGHREELIAKGDLLQHEDSLDCAGVHFPLGEIKNMAVVLTGRLLLSCQDAYYELRSEHPVNFRKYYHLWETQ